MSLATQTAAGFLRVAQEFKTLRSSALKLIATPTTDSPALWVAGKSDAVTASTLAVGDDIKSSTAAGRARLQVGNTTGVAELILGQASNRALLFGWVYNATAASAFGILETFGGNNELRVQNTTGPLRLGGSGGKLGFFGTVPVVKPALTHSRLTESIADTQLRTALAGMGLVADTTTDAPASGPPNVYPPFKAGLFQTPTFFQTQTSATPARNRLAMYPFHVGGTTPWQTDAIKINVNNVPNVSGSGVAVSVGLYREDADGFPDGSQQVLAYTFTEADLVQYQITRTLPTPITLTPGRYWMMGLYTYTTAPVTPPQLTLGTSPNGALPADSGQAPGFPSRGYTINDFTSLPTTALNKSLVTPGLNNDFIFAQLRRGPS